ncbi:MAG: glycosyltransferase family 4 protein [Clostridia bacterium]|nr:glycosyltransferase family 4 protein [Clostridia bacterium]
MKILYITSLSGRRINGFMRSAIIAAKQLGYEFVMACNTEGMDKDGYVADCEEYGITVKHIDFQRNPLDRRNLVAYKQLNALMCEDNYDVVHCNTPIGGLLGRLSAKKAGIKNVIYQAHGFHFYQGAPIPNWAMYYPVERWMAKYTDTLVTITKEDYERAQRWKTCHVEYVHGVGINLNTFSQRESDERNNTLREQLGISKNAYVLLSVGELNENKNHMSVIKAVEGLPLNIVYVICGEGELRNEYEQFIQKKSLTNRIILAGFCQNVEDYYRMADLFVFPSHREGIPGSIMEAMATGVPVVASNTRGIRDLVLNEEYLFDSHNSDAIRKRILWAEQQDHTSVVESYRQTIIPYAFDSVVKELKAIYEQYLLRIQNGKSKQVRNKSFNGSSPAHE